MLCFSLSTGWQSTRPRPLQKRPRWYQAEPIDDPDSAVAPDCIRKGLLEGHWLGNDTLDYLGQLIELFFGRHNADTVLQIVQEHFQF